MQAEPARIRRGAASAPSDIEFGQPARLDRPPDFVAENSFDLQALFAAKNPVLARRLPAAGWRVLERLTHRRTINRILLDWRDLPCRAFAGQALKWLDVDYEVTGEEPPPPQEWPIFVANHPSGGLDGLVMIDWLLGRYADLRTPVNDVLLNLPHLAPLLFPIDKFRPRRDLKQALDALFAMDKVVLLFPAGRTARRRGGEIHEAEWQKLPAMMAQRHHRPIVPVHIDSHNSRRFYLVHRIRTALGIRPNLEMLLLIDELMRPSCHLIRICVGRAIAPAELEASGVDQRQRAAWLRQRVLDLQDDTCRPMPTDRTS